MTTPEETSHAALAARRQRAAERARVTTNRRTARAKSYNSSPNATNAPSATTATNARADRPTPPGSKPQIATRSDGDQRIVLTSIIAFITLVGGLGIIAMLGSVRKDRAKAVMATSFARIHVRQQSFRMLNSRFATWPELQASGATLPPRQRVTASNADASHWFMSIRDRDTDLSCDRTGELWDESGNERQAVCRTVKP